MSDSSFDPQTLNEELVDRLRHRALICELDIDTTLVARLCGNMELLRQIGATRSKSSLRRYPALVATFLVAEGIFNYEEGAFFPNLTVKGLDRNVLTDVFEYALKTLRLEKFKILIDDGAQRYLAPILAHGGIPKHSLPKFFRLVLDAERRGANEASEMLAYWREHRSVFVNIHKPVERFLLYGGDMSHDFLNRCLDLVFAQPTVESDLPPDYFALPRYVCDAFLAIEPQERKLRSKRSRSGSAALARAEIVLDPWDSVGPMLVLPAVPEGYINHSWNIIAPGYAGRQAASRVERVVPLAPARHWAVELRGSGQPGRITTYPGLGRSAAMLFEYPGGKLVADPGRLRESRVWILRPDRDAGVLRTRGGVTLIPYESAPPLVGPWEGYSLDAFDLPDSERITVGLQDDKAEATEVDSSIWVRIRGAQVTLDRQPIPGVRTTTGLPVFSSTPSLRFPSSLDTRTPTGSTAWAAKVTVSETEHEFDGDALQRLGPDVVASLMPHEMISQVLILVRGSLGMDFRSAFCVIPGLAIEQPDSITLPSLTKGSVVGHVTVCGPNGVSRQLDIADGQDTIDACVEDAGGRKEDLRISVPCLQWALVDGASNRTELGQQAFSTSGGALAEGKSLLIVRTRMPGVSLRLQVRNRDVVLQEDNQGRTAGEDGRWAFDLRKFSDSIRISASPRLTVILSIGGHDIEIGVIRAELQAGDLAVRSRLAGGDCTIHLSWHQERQLTQRIVRLWSLSAPWRAPVVAPIPDGDTSETTITRSENELRPGFYLAEVVVDDGWTSVPRPQLDARNTRLFRLGSDDDEDRWLSRVGRENAFSVLEIACSTGRWVRDLTGDEVEVITPSVLEMTSSAALMNAYSALDGAAVSHFIQMAPHAFIRGVEAAAIDWGNRHDTRFLSAILDILPAANVLSPTIPPLPDTTNLWELSPELAAAFDLPHSVLPEVAARIEAGLGIDIQDAAKREVIPQTRARVPELQRYYDMSSEHLEALRQACNLIPKRPLDLDMQAAVQLEWLIANRNRTLPALEWIARYRALRIRLTELKPSLQDEIRRICAPQPFASGFPIIVFPEMVYIAALHIVADTKLSRQSIASLEEIIEACPGIISRSLILASLHTHLAS